MPTTAAIIGAVAAVAGAGAQAHSDLQQRQAQHHNNAEQQEAMDRARQAEADRVAGEEAKNQQAAQSARLAQLRSMAGAQGLGSTMLTGPQGPAQPMTAQKTLLGQ